MSKVFLALGANLGDRRLNFIKSIDQLKKIGNIKAIGGLYQSSAYGYTKQPFFYNSALLLDTTLAPDALLVACKGIEKLVGRKYRRRWRPRELDLDIIFYGNIVFNNKKLTVPHPDFHNRRFVLLPLVDICDNFISPTHTMTIAEILKNCPDTTSIKLISKKWYSNEPQL
jgi:2-amino-4-hydroxy-6-hydroxymethyldihydropteridine diphosphokinase